MKKESEKLTYLVLETRVFSLSVLTNDGEIDISVTSRETRNRLAEDEGSVDVELLTHCDVP